MARVLYTAAPQEVPQGPSAIPGGGYQRIQSSPAQFGALIGQAEQRLGAGAEQAGSELFGAYQHQQQIYNEVTADDAYNNLQRSYHNILFGDPNDPTKVGYYALRGADALTARPIVAQQLDQVRQQIKATMRSPMASIAFERDSRRLQLFTMDAVGRHADQQMDAYAVATQRSAKQLELQAIGSYYSDPQAVAGHTEDYVRAAVREAQSVYGGNADPAIINNAITKARSEAAAAQIRGYLAHNDPIGAARVLRENEGRLEPATALRFHGALSQANVSSAVDRAMGVISSSGKPVVTPAEVAAEAVRQNVDPALANTTAAIESGHGANVGQGEHARVRGNIFQMGPSERSSVGGSRESMGSPQQQVAEGVAFLANKKQELTSALGRPPSNAEIYLAHQQGTAGAVGLLTKPNARAGDVVGDAAIRDNGGDPNAPASAFVQRISQIYNSKERQFAQGGPALSFSDAGTVSEAGVPTKPATAAPDYSAAERSILEDPSLNEVEKRQALNRVKERANLEWTDQTRKYEQHQREMRAASAHAASDIISRLIKDPTSVDPKADIADNPAFADDPSRKEALYKMQQAAMAGGNDHDTKTYGRGFYQAFREVHAPADDPNRITDPSQLYSRVGPDGDLTVAGVEKLARELQDKRTPEGEAWAEMQKQFMRNAHAQISGHDEGLHIRDPRGEELFLKFMAQALPAIQEAKAAGKAPAEIFSPDSKDYVGKLISNFKRPMSQWVADIAHDATGTPSGPPEGAVAFLKANPNLRSAFDEKYGVGASDKVLGPAVAPQPSLAPPIARP